MAPERLDTIVLGGGVEALVAATVLAQAGRQVTLLSPDSEDAPAFGHDDAIVDLAVVRELELAAHGLRLGAPPAHVALASGAPLILWPHAEATEAALAAHALRDADAWGAFRARLTRALAEAAAGRASVTAWITSTDPRDGAGRDLVTLGAAPLAAVLSETFETPALCGMLAARALDGIAASPFTPGTGSLLLRQSVSVPIAGSSARSFVSGGAPALRRALLARLRVYNNAQPVFGAAVASLVAERDAVQGANLADGASLRAASVIAAAGCGHQMPAVDGLRRPSAPGPSWEYMPARARITAGRLPAFPGLDAAVTSAGAVIHLNPSLDRLSKAHAAFSAGTMLPDPCISLRVRPTGGAESPVRWELFVSMACVPAETVEGPWIGARRDRLLAMMVRAIDTYASGFAASIESAVLDSPAEAVTLLDAGTRGVRTQAASRTIAGTPPVEGASLDTGTRGLTIIRTTPFAPAGEGGNLAALALGPGRRTRTNGDA